MKGGGLAQRKQIGERKTHSAKQKSFGKARVSIGGVGWGPSTGGAGELGREAHPAEEYDFTLRAVKGRGRDEE